MSHEPKQKPKFKERISMLLKKFLSPFTLQMNKRPVLMTVALLIVVNLAVIFIAAAVAMQLNPRVYYGGELVSGYANYFWALVDAATWLAAPNAVLAHAGNLPMQVLVLFVFLVGMIIFTGTIISIITTQLRNYINKKSDAKGKLSLADHIVILNYNPKVAAMLIDLMYVKCKATVIILSNKEKEFIKDELAREIAGITGNKPTGKLKLILRKGSPESLAELQDICLESARGVLVVEPEKEETQEALISDSAYSTVRLVMKLSNVTFVNNCPIGVEADRYQTVELIQDLNKSVPGLKDKQIQVFSHNHKLGQFMALSILCPPLSRVLMDLLSNNGCIFKPSDKSKEDYLSLYKSGIPVASLDKTYVLTPNEDLAYKKRYQPFVNSRLLAPSKIQKNRECLKLFVIGENRKTDYMLNAISTEKCPVEITRFNTDDIANFASTVCASDNPNTIALILSDDSVPVSQYDANVFLTLIEFSKQCDLPCRRFKIIAELLEPDNLRAVEEFNVRNIIISTRIISFLATKLLTDPEAEKFYEDVFTHSNVTDEIKFDIWIDSAKCLFDFEDSKELHFTSYTEFVNASYYGTDKKIMPLGKVEEDGSVTYFCYDMDNTALVLGEDTQVLYVEYLS